MKIAQFLMEAGWYVEAKQELAQLKKDAPWEWTKVALDRFDGLTLEIDAANTRYLIEQAKVAREAGKYELLNSFLPNFDPKGATAGDLNDLAELKALVLGIQPKYDTTKRLLRALHDRVTGVEVQEANAAVAGGMAMLVVPLKKLNSNEQALVDGATAVLAEIHPDTHERVESFRELAEQAERDERAGKAPRHKPTELLALAVSGWLKGKNGSMTDVAIAAKQWRTRVMLLKYLITTVGNDRAALLQQYQASSDKLDADELAQIVGLLPPINAEDPNAIRGDLVPVAECGANQTYKIESGPLPDDSLGVTYYVRLPSEYHIGRSYPVILALNKPSFGAEKMIGLLAAEADRYGFIVAAPEWTARFKGKGFDYTGQDHRIISSCLRELSRKFQVDQDRVFAYGYGEGANFALDLSMSRPSLFAGVVTMGAQPIARFYDEYWKNAQKCPVYSICGELSVASLEALRKIYSPWMQYGFYSILSVYKGRANTWFSAEVPLTFDWMNRKKRVKGVQSLRLDGGKQFPWQTFREGDDRFYWIGVTELNRANTFDKPERPALAPLPAEFSADIRNNRIMISGVRGMKEITIWLQKDMIEWTQKVSAVVDTSLQGMRPTQLEPDVSLMLEELYRTGDRKMLFFGKLVFKTNG
jgi:hypothetical protein